MKYTNRQLRVLHQTPKARQLHKKKFVGTIVGNNVRGEIIINDVCTSYVNKDSIIFCTDNIECNGGWEEKVKISNYKYGWILDDDVKDIEILEITGNYEIY